jgi:hypothetical protein
VPGGRGVECQGAVDHHEAAATLYEGGEDGSRHGEMGTDVVVERGTEMGQRCVE